MTAMSLKPHSSAGLTAALLALAVACGSTSLGGGSEADATIDASPDAAPDAAFDDGDLPDAALVDGSEVDSISSPATDLLCNESFEEGDATADCWQTSPPDAVGVDFVWDDGMGQSGTHCAVIESDGLGAGMWQQVVPVEAGTVYLFSGYVGFADLAPPAESYLQVVWRDSANALIEIVDYPHHDGTRDFALDYPPGLKLRAPEGAATAEVNLVLHGAGTAFFDDIFFGPAPVGTISGRVTGEGRPLEGATVRIVNEPWGVVYEATTGADGNYALADVPVAYPRYILLASRTGYRTRSVGRVAAVAEGVTTVDFDLQVGRDPTDELHVQFGTLAHIDRAQMLPRFPRNAVIPADEMGYPESVRPFLEDDEVIDSDHPDVVALADAIRAGVPDPTSTRDLVWAVYEWVSLNIEHGSVYPDPIDGSFESPYMDVTSGIYQTISVNGWGWGHSFVDWAYRPHELLAVRGGICVEHAMLTTALLRALNVPARPFSGRLEFWAQDAPGDGDWFGLSTTSGRTSYRQHGSLGAGFATAGLDHFPTRAGPMVHEDWNAENPGMWRESHPRMLTYSGTSAGRAKALADMQHLSDTGEMREPPPAGGGNEQYAVYYRDLYLKLYDIGDQRILDVRFPIVADTGPYTSEDEHVYWTNHPECVTSSWVEEISNPPVEGVERWFHIEFDLTSLVE